MSRTMRQPFASTNHLRRRTAWPPYRPRVEVLEPRLVLSRFFEAENVAVLGGIGPYWDGSAIHDYPRIETVLDSGHTGHDGCCYVNLAYSDDSTITWDNVREDHAGDYTVAFRYSMDTYYTNMYIPARPMGLKVNGVEITRALNFTATGDSAFGGDPWSVWADLPVTVHLHAGVNSIELFATNLAATGANPHVDSMTITPVARNVLPDTPANLTVSAGVGTVDLAWDPSAIASSYNVYRSTTSGNETLIAAGVTSTYFFDDGLATDGTSYYYQVSAVNAAGESARTAEASASPVAPAGLVFSDDFSNGPSPAWTFTPDDYWAPQVGLLTDAGGDTVANVPQTATVVLPAGAGSWQADLLTKEGYGAGVDDQGNPGISGLLVQSTDGLNAVSFSVFPDFSVNVGTTVNGVFQGWTRVGSADPAYHYGHPEMLRHTYDIRLDANGTFTALFDGQVLASGINAGSPSAWADGIGTGTLFTQSTLDDRHLSTSFDNVRALALAGTTARTGTGPELPIATGLTSPVLADLAVGRDTSASRPSALAESAREIGSWNESSATAQAMTWVQASPAERSAGAHDGQTPKAYLVRATPNPLYQDIASGGRESDAVQEAWGYLQ